MNNKILGVLIVILLLIIGAGVLYQADIFLKKVPSNTNQDSNPNQTEINFNFDSGSPQVLAGISTPFSQTINGVSATFTSPQDPAGFSVQNAQTTFYVIPQFSGNYLVFNQQFGSELDISFSTNISWISITFITIEQYKATEHDHTTELQLEAYHGETLMGTGNAYGTYINDYFAQGILSFTGNQQFNTVKIPVPSLPGAARGFFVDNIKVKTL